MKSSLSLRYAVASLLFTMLVACVRDKNEPSPNDQALLRRLENAKSAAIPLPQAREVLLHLQSEGMQNRLSILKKETPGTSEERRTARASFEQLTTALEAAQQWKPAPVYQIAHEAGPIVIDGVCNEVAWKQARRIPLGYAVNANKPAPAPQASARLLWDGKNLYAAFDVSDESIVAPITPRDGNVFLNDCVELFLMSSRRRGRYWEINISPSGAVMDQFCSKYQNKPLSLFRRDLNLEGLRYATKIHHPSGGKKTGYTVEVAIPWNQLPDCLPRKGTVCWILMAWADRDSSDGPLKFFSHAPMLGTFHNIWTMPQTILAE